MESECHYCKTKNCCEKPMRRLLVGKRCCAWAHTNYIYIDIFIHLHIIYYIALLVLTRKWSPLSCRCSSAVEHSPCVHDALGSVFNTTVEAVGDLKLLSTLIMDQAGPFLLTWVLWVKLEAEVTELQITRVVHSRIMPVALSVLTFLQMAQPPLFKTQRWLLPTIRL